jgi:hypothetical protein
VVAGENERGVNIDNGGEIVRALTGRDDGAVVVDEFAKVIVVTVELFWGGGALGR